MKKFISVIAASMVLATSAAVAPVSVSADSCVAFEIGNASTKGAVKNGKLAQDETVIIPVDITENVGMTSFIVEFTYESPLKPTGINRKRDVSDYAEIGSFTENKETWERVLWLEDSCRDTTKCGVLLQIEIKVPAGTPVGKYEVGFNDPETQITNYNFDSLEYKLTSGYVEVKGDSSPAVTTASQPAQTTVTTTTKKSDITTTTSKTESTTKETTTSSEKVSETTATERRPTAAQDSENSTETLNTWKVDNSTPDENAGGNAADISESVSGDVTDISDDAVSSDSDAAVSSDNAADSSKSSNDNKKSKADKTDKSPSTGAAGVVIPAVLLAVSSAGVIIAASKNKKK